MPDVAAAVPPAAVEAAEAAAPVLLDERTPEEGARLDALRAGTDVTIVDTLDEQLADLERALDPPNARNAELIEERAGARRRRGGGMWAYYPWRRTLVSLLRRADFQRLRTARNRPLISDPDQQRLLDTRIAVAGLSVGQSIAVTMALQGIGRAYNLADSDTLGVSNLNRLRAGLPELGLNKSVLAARAISEIDPYLGISCYRQGVTRETLDAFLRVDGEPVDLLIEECDSFDVKVLLRQRARELGIPVLMHTSDRGLIDVERFDREPDRPLGHGAWEQLDPDRLSGLTTGEKLAPLLRFINIEQVSPDLLAALLDIGHSLDGWPQLASCVAAGGGVSAEVAGRVLLDDLAVSGRWYVDTRALIQPETASVVPVPPQQRAIERDAGRPRIPRSSGSIRDAARAVVTAATLAPSAFNSQPWRFDLEGGHLRCSLDSSRDAAPLDTGPCTNVVAIGAALQNAVLAAGAFGIDALPSVTDDPDRLWTLELDEPRAPSAADEAILAAIRRRHTNRRVGDGESLTSPERDAVTGAVRPEWGTVTLLERDSVAEIARLAGEADRVRTLSAPLRDELCRALRWHRHEVARGDGVDIETLELDDARRALLPLLLRPDALDLVRGRDHGRLLEAHLRDNVRSSAALALIAAHDAKPSSVVQAGRLSQQVWMAAEACGLAVAPITDLCVLMRALDGPEPLEPFAHRTLSEMSTRYETVLGPRVDSPHVMLLRLSHAPAATRASARRPLGQVAAALG